MKQMESQKKQINHSLKMPNPIYDANPEWVKLYELAWEIALNNVEEFSNPKYLPQMTCMKGSGKIWQWDSCFMALFSYYSNGNISALNNLDNLYSLQRADGYISMTYDLDTALESYGERVNPPLFSWVELEHYNYTGDKERLSRVYPILKKYFLWLKENRRRANGLYYFEDTGSSGMDNSPRSGYLCENLKGSDVCFIDISCQQVLAARKLAGIAKIIGETTDVKPFKEEADELSELINYYCWSERTGFYYDCFARDDVSARHNFLSCKTIAAFWAIISGVAKKSQVESLVKYLQDPEEFCTEHPVPSLSRKDPNYQPDGFYWLGGVWAPTNYMVIRGLCEHEYHDLAREIANKHLSAMSSVMQNPEHGGIWEAYAPESLKPATNTKGCGLVKDNFVGWSGLGPIAMFIENIIGLTFDAVSNTILWRISDECRHGLENIKFNGKKISLICEDRKNEKSENSRHVHVECDGNINLRIVIHNAEHRKVSITLDAGKHELSI